MRTYDIEVHDAEGASTRYSVYASGPEQALRACADGPLREFIIDVAERRFVVQASTQEIALTIAADRLAAIAAAGVTP
jgi:hypothetical protein